MKTLEIERNRIYENNFFNFYGQLGQGTTDNIGDGVGEMGDNLAAIDLGSDKKIYYLFAKGYFTCAILDDYTVKCWGANDYGQLGQGTTDNIGDGAGEMGGNLAAIDLGAGRTAISITSGLYHTCTILDDATVKCWGRNDYGQLGQGTTDNIGDGVGEMGDNLAAIDLGTGRTATLITGGGIHTCTLLDDATVKCWGDNALGELGQGNTEAIGGGAGEMGDNIEVIDLGTDGSLSAALPASSIDAGTSHTCVKLESTAIKCWGYNGYGQLGQGNSENLGDDASEMGNSLEAVSL